MSDLNMRAQARENTRKLHAIRKACPESQNKSLLPNIRVLK